MYQRIYVDEFYQRIKVAATAITATNAPVPATASSRKLFELSTGDSKSSKVNWLFS